jgi:dTMP kinase
MEKNIYPGKFIVLEGLDGAGTTSQIELLAKHLKEAKNKVHITKEPTQYLIGGLIKSWLANDWKSTPECLQLLFTADRAYHLDKEMIPLLKKGVTVISDRYFFSTLAYGLLEIEDKKWLFGINDKFILPDLVIFIDSSPEVCIQRIENERFGVELFEKVEKLKKVRKSYLEILKEFKNIHIVNGDKSIKNVFGDIKEIIKNKF